CASATLAAISAIAVAIAAAVVFAGTAVAEVAADALLRFARAIIVRRCMVRPPQSGAPSVPDSTGAATPAAVCVMSLPRNRKGAYRSAGVSKVAFESGHFR